MISFSLFLLCEASGDVVTDFRNLNDYGYWIADDGKMYRVGEFQHDDVLDKLRVSSYGKAFRKGWIRIARERSGLNIEFENKKPSKAAVRSLSQFLRNGYFEKIYVDISDDRDVIEPGNPFRNPRDVMTVVAKHSRLH